jgi:predicted nucleotidyltransferase
MKILRKQTINELKRAGVSTLYFFGSRAQNVQHEHSDFDFGILLADPSEAARTPTKLYDRIYPILASITKPKTLEADVIDIVFLDSPLVTLEMKTHIVQHGKILFDKNPQHRMDVEADILLKTADFAPLRKLMSQALLERSNL